MSEPWRLIQADVIDGLRQLPAGSVHCVVTSPPYWGLRDYGVAGQIGLEPTVEEWVQKMVAVFEEVKRVLRDDATCWVNLGDSYGANVGNGFKPDGGRQRGTLGTANPVTHPTKPKDLIGQPWRFAFALQAAGWYLRSDIIWSKPNPMPESVTDRPTKAHEYVFLLTKAERYYYDAEAIREPHATPLKDRPNKTGKCAQRGQEAIRPRGNLDATGDAAARYWSEGGRNKRTVWEIATAPYPEAHFATFPPALVEPCIRAGTSEKGVCPECGKPWERAVEREFRGNWNPGPGSNGPRKTNAQKEDRKGKEAENLKPPRTTGWEPGCDHAYGNPVPATVLDPFAGTSTTGQVALENGREFIGIELDPKSVKLSEKRLKATAFQTVLV